MTDREIRTKAAVVLGAPVNLERLLRAICDGKWTPSDAARLKQAETNPDGSERVQ